MKFANDLELYLKNLKSENAFKVDYIINNLKQRLVAFILFLQNSAIYNNITQDYQMNNWIKKFLKQQ